LEGEGAREDEGVGDFDVDVADGWRAMARSEVAFVWGTGSGFVGISGLLLSFAIEPGRYSAEKTSW